MTLRILDGAKGAVDMGIGGCCKRGASSHARNSSRRSDAVERRGQSRARSGIVPEPVLQAAAVCRKSSFGKGSSRSREKSGFRRIEKIHFVGALVLGDFGWCRRPTVCVACAAQRRSKGCKLAREGHDIFPGACRDDQGRRRRSGGNQRGEILVNAIVILMVRRSRSASARFHYCWRLWGRLSDYSPVSIFLP